MLAFILFICLLQSALGCVDKSQLCPSYTARKDYFCQKYEWVRKNCQNLCNLCGCKDKLDYCNGIVRYCTMDGYKKWMEDNCRKTCGHCQYPTTQPPTTRPPVTTMPSNCRDLSRYCKNYKNSGYCDKHADWMSRNCRYTCNKCGTVATTAPSPTTQAPIHTTMKPGTNPPKGTCGISSVQGRVIAGEDAKPGQWPWQIAMQKNGRFSCGGSLITPEWVVTAAHCVYRNSASSIKIVVGDLKRGETSGHEQTIQVKNVVWHPSYKKTSNRLDYDIAMMKLSQPARLGSHVKTVCLPKHGEAVAVGTKCYISGWGKTTHPGGSVLQLQHASLNVLGKTECNRMNSKYATITDKMVCATNQKPARQSGCHGDSGGPFVCERGDGSWVLHGAVSWGSPRCDVNDANTVFARVSEFRNWIDTTMQTYV